MSQRTVRIGVIADTHGLLRPEALAALQGSDHILHAGDIGTTAILSTLRTIAPVTAVRGNNDGVAAFDDLPELARVMLGGVLIALIHDIKEWRATQPCQIVVSGHSHKPRVETVDGRLYLNSGSAGPRRFSLPITIATLVVGAGVIHKAEVHVLQIGAKPR